MLGKQFICWKSLFAEKLHMLEKHSYAVKFICTVQDMVSISCILYSVDIKILKSLLRLKRREYPN